MINADSSSSKTYQQITYFFLINFHITPMLTYAQYLIVWSSGKEILSKVEEVDSLLSEDYRRVREAVSGEGEGSVILRVRMI